MGTLILDFADQLFSFLALKYEIVPPRTGAPPIEEYDWPSEQFSIDIARAVMMFSYTYRSAYKRHFKTVAPVICEARNTAKLYPVIFARVTYKTHSPLKILILCSFISELYLFIYFQTNSGDVTRDYTLPCMHSFNSVYKNVLSKIDDPVLKWDDVKRAATLIAGGYDVLEPIMRTEHPSESKFFFRSVQDVLEAQGKRRPENVSEVFEEASNEPSTSQGRQNTSAKSKYVDASRRMATKSATDKLTQQLQETSLSACAGANPIPDIPQFVGKKSKKLAQLLKASACAPEEAESASAGICLPKFPKIEAPRVPMFASARDTMISGLRALDRDNSYSLSKIEQFASLPGFEDGKYTSFEDDPPKEEDSDESAKDSTVEIEKVETKQSSNAAKGKSKKSKKKKSSKRR